MTKQRKNATQNNEKTPPTTQKDEIFTQKDETTPGKKTQSKTIMFSLFLVVFFVFSL